MRRVLAAGLIFAGFLFGQQTAGVRPGGAAILPNGWTLTPAGEQVPLSTLPMALELSRDHRYALALNAGYLRPSVSVVDLETRRVVDSANLPDAWLGMTLNPAGDKLYVSGGARASVFEAEFENGKLKVVREFAAVARDERTADDFIGDVRLSADGGLLYAANVFQNRVEILNAKSGLRVGRFETGARPYRMRLAPDGEHLWISHWGELTVGLYSLGDRRLIESIEADSLPGDLLIVPGEIETPDQATFPVTARLFVVSSNTNSVLAFGLTDNNRAQLLGRIPLGPSLSAPAGTAPTALAVSPDDQRLYVTCSGNNLIAVADISGDRTRLMGAIPTGWYPTATAETRDGRLVYLNGKGAGSVPTPNGPDPTNRAKSADYLPALRTGSMGFLPGLDGESLAALTQRAAENILYDEDFVENPGIPAGNPVGPQSPIEHVVYVIKENRTFDQILGDVESANGDPDLVVFGEDSAPNHRKLAREFVLLDNFYASGSVSTDGLNWTAAGIANDFVEKLWPTHQAHRLERDFLDVFESAAVPPAGYLWSNAAGAGLDVRVFGLWARRGKDGRMAALDPGLTDRIDLQYPPFDLTIPDDTRVDRFLVEFERLEKAGDLPRLMVLHLPNDQTAGRASGFPTAQAMMAEHDLALGRLVEGISRSKSWERTAVFVVEDDAQDGADHVDAHRSIALVASPWIRRGIKDSTFYSTESVLRTIELILGLKPMTQFDGAATPMWRIFSPELNKKPYEAAEPKQRINEKNPSGQRVTPRRA